MTVNRKAKLASRQLAAEHGITYTTALRLNDMAQHLSKSHHVDYGDAVQLILANDVTSPTALDRLLASGALQPRAAEAN